MQLDKFITKVALGLFVLFCVSDVFAVDIQFPEEELARESVYPVFDNPTPVKKRNVELSGRFEVGAFGGWSMNDALFEGLLGGGMLTYHFTEIHAAQIQGAMFSTKASSNVARIEAGSEGSVVNLAKTPAAKNYWLFNYQITPYYGKISITKEAVMNLSIFATAGAGQMAIGDSSYLTFALGIGQKLYFTKNFGIRADLKALFHQAPNGIKSNIPSDPQPNSYYDKHNVTDGHMTVGVIYLL